MTDTERNDPAYYDADDERPTRAEAERDAADHRWIVTFGQGYNLRNNYAVLGEHADQTSALEEVGRHWGYTASGAVRCAFVYPISELERTCLAYGMTEVPLGTHLHERE